MTRRTVAVFTGSRAEYGHLSPVIAAISKHPGLSLQLLVSGSHLDKSFGYTRDEITADGFEIAREIHIDANEDDLGATARAIASCIVGTSRALAELSPHFVMIYSDRFEGFGAVVAGSQTNVPVVHVEGGDLTEGGALDDSIRHAMTKLSHLHFTTNEQARERVLRLGEEPWRVFNTGLPALDFVASGSFASYEQLQQQYGIDVERPLVVFTQHSVTTEYDQAARQVRPSLEALRQLAAEGIQVVVTYPNNDAGGRSIIAEIEPLRGVPGFFVHRSLGRFNYHGLLRLCGRGRGVCVGNSSSGIKETPVFGCPTVDIGSRQEGRLRAGNVLQADYDSADILRQVKRSLEDESWRAHCRGVTNPYGDGTAGVRIAETLATIELGPRLLRKKMTY